MLMNMAPIHEFIYKYIYALINLAFMLYHKVGVGDSLHKTQMTGKVHRLRDHFVYVPSQWEMTLHRNVISHWLGTYTKWSLQIA